MLPSIKYYIVKDGALTDIERLLDESDTDVVQDELDRMADDQPANAGTASVLTRCLTEQRPGPLGAEAVRKLAGENGGVDLLRSESPDGDAEYLLPQGGRFLHTEQIAESAGIEDQARFIEALAEFFSSPHVNEVPASVAYLTIDANMLSPDEELPEPLRRLAAAEMRESGLTEMTVLVWTE